ncbi:MAG: AAA family ATPase [Anaerostipes hadrus]
MLIYGRNATGKTNLGQALLDIGYTISSSIRYQRNGIMLNADSNEKVAVFDYEFQFGSTEVCYRYSKNSNQELSYEKLVINDNCIFECDFDKKIYNFDNLDYINTETANIELYKQSLESAENDEISESKLPFLRWLINNVALKNDSVLIKLSNYIRKMMIVTVSSSIANGILGRGVNQRFYEQLESTKGLQDLEDF